MKMILAVMPTNLSDLIANELLEVGYRVTKFASTAGLLSGGTTTLMIVAESNQIERALDLIRSNVPARDPEDNQNARLIIYVLNVKDFARV